MHPSDIHFLQELKIQERNCIESHENWKEYFMRE